MTLSLRRDAIGLLSASLLVAVTAAATAGCSRRRGTPVATLLETQGQVQRSDGEGWRDVAASAAFVVGDTLRTGPRSGARLRVSNGGVIRVGENGQLRFSSGAVPAQPGPGISVELGSAEIENSGEDLSVVTAMGPTRVKRGARVRVSAREGAASLEVLVGRAELSRDDRPVVVEAGQGVAVKIGNAVLERFDVSVGQAVMERDKPPPARAPAIATVDQDPPPPAPETSAAREPGPPPAPSATRDGAGRADVTLAAGENAVIHDSRPPLAVRLRFEDVCPTGATVEVGTGRQAHRLTGAVSVVLRLRGGTNAYRVRCAGDERDAKARAAGTLSVRRDSGNVPLSRTAPVNTIDADGRRYTVMFQTRLPKLTLLWPTAPATRSFELYLTSATGTRVFQASSPRHQLASGSLPEGTYTWWYQARDGQQSPRTTTTIRFDNAAPTAQFFTGANKTAPPGTVPIDGVTLEGAKVTAGQQVLAVDDHGRFREAIEPLAGDDAVAVRLEHPRTGVHYYIRRRHAPLTSAAARRDSAPSRGSATSGR